jgi:autotransporter-associated beta strand protein
MVLSGTSEFGYPFTNSTFSGDIAINQGKLVAAAVPYTPGASALGLVSNTRTITVNAGATLEFDVTRVFGQPNSTTVPNLVVNGGVVTNGTSYYGGNAGLLDNPLNNITLSDGTLTSTDGRAPNLGTGTVYGAWDLNGAITSYGNSVITSAVGNASGQVLLATTASASWPNTTFDVEGGTLTVSTSLVDGVASPGCALVKTGTGALLLAASNNYSGGTTINNGVVQFGNSAALARSAVTINSGELDLNATSAAVLSLNGGTGTIVSDENSTPGTSVLTIGASGGTFGGTIRDGLNGRQVSLKVTSPWNGGINEFTLTAPNTFSGITSIPGALMITNGLALQNSTWDTSGSGIFDLTELGSGTVTLGGLQGDGTTLPALDGNSIFLRVGNNNTNTTFTGAIGGYQTLAKIGSGTLTMTGTISTAIGSVEVDSGTLVLSGTGLYTGGTTVEGGTLILTNPAAIEDGTSLTVGNPAAFSPAPVVPNSAVVVAGLQTVSQPAIAAVPEPGTLVLLAAVLGIAAIGRCFRRKRSM